MTQASRYSRQTILPEIRPEGQEKFARASVLCVGAGGLGSPALLYLTAAGVGRIGIIDPDVVEESNLQRQILFTTEDLGHNKAARAKAHLSARNPDVTLTAYPESLTADNALNLFADYDVIVDGTDNFATKFLINDAAIKTGKPFVYGSILGFEGQVASFGLRGGPCYRCLFPHAPRENVPSCAQAGVIGAVAGLIGTTQAMEVLKIILKHQDLPPLSGTLWRIDTRTMHNSLFPLPKDPACPVCSQEKELIMLENTSTTCAGPIRECTPTEAKAQTTARLLDVREDHEWAAGHITGAEHFALSRLAEGQYPDCAKDTPLVLYCKGGFRSKQAAELLQARGYTNLTSMTGGYDLWCKTVL